MRKSRFTPRDLAIAGIIAGIYAALTLLLPIPQYHGIQLRVAEAMTLLPFLFPGAIPGLAVGCFLANLLGSPFVLDWVFGTLATLIAAWFTYRSKHLLVAPVWPILFNGLIIGTMLVFMITGRFEWGVWLTMMAEVAISEFVVCFAIGVPFMRAIQHYKLLRFFKI